MSRLTNTVLGAALVLQSTTVLAHGQEVANRFLDAVTDYLGANRWTDATTYTTFLVDSRVSVRLSRSQNSLSSLHGESVLTTKSPDKIRILGADSAAACFMAIGKCSAGRNVLLQLGKPELRGDTTVVRVTIQSVAAPTSREIHAKSATMYLLRKGATWTVVKVIDIVSS